MATVRLGEFEWDDAKARANERKHRVSFAEAIGVFLDPLGIAAPDIEHPRPLHAHRHVARGSRTLRRIGRGR